MILSAIQTKNNKKQSWHGYCLYNKCDNNDKNNRESREERKMKEVRMPKIGFSEADITLVEWLKQPGDKIEEGDAIAVIQGEKLTNELESEVDGIMGEIFVQEGEAVAINAHLANIEN